LSLSFLDGVYMYICVSEYVRVWCRPRHYVSFYVSVVYDIMCSSDSINVIQLCIDTYSEIFGHVIPRHMYIISCQI
jgi:hypothetical protein